MPDDIREVFKRDDLRILVGALSGADAVQVRIELKGVPVFEIPLRTRIDERPVFEGQAVYVRPGIADADD